MKNILFLGCFLLGNQIFAWGELGHSVVGEVAYQLLTPRAKVKVDKWLNGMSLAEASNWPDKMRSNRDFQNTNIASWHFTDMPVGSTTMPSNENVIWAIELSLSILKGERPPYSVPPKNSTLNTNPVVVGEKEALYFLAHFVQDVHQPLHVGNGKDRGGNNCLVKWFGSVRDGEGYWNLHSVWDVGLLDKAGFGRGGWVRDIQALLKTNSPAAILAKKTPLEWALESASFRPAVYPQLDPSHPVKETEQPYCNNPKYEKLPGKINPEAPHAILKAEHDAMEAKILADPQIPRLSYDYRAAQIDLVKRRMLESAVRLANLLNNL